MFCKGERSLLWESFLAGDPSFVDEGYQQECVVL
jgi:hypothetical protein